mmetsp:Transcript_68884/g.149908  ORF Transcript_68884/g.149908 Transcript_68884/m.149908 type:complete len:400 (+) Transcript_68884:86-1285(+)
MASGAPKRAGLCLLIASFSKSLCAVAVGLGRLSVQEDSWGLQEPLEAARSLADLQSAGSAPFLDNFLGQENAVSALVNSSTDHRHYNITPACDKEVSPESRLFLMALSGPFRGSTALEQVLMSSSKLATLCSLRNTTNFEALVSACDEKKFLNSAWRCSAQPWQCEGGGIMRSYGYTDDVRTWDFEGMLGAYSSYWDLRRPVLLDKTPNLHKAFLREGDGIMHANLPSHMTRIGIKRLDLAYVLLWRPICLLELSEHGRACVAENTPAECARIELVVLESLVHSHRAAVNKGAKISVVNMADLIWRPHRTATRLQEFLPCLGELDVDFTPTLNVHVFSKNRWKAQGSVRSFGERTNATNCCGYNTAFQQCKGNKNYFRRLGKNEQARAAAAVEYLQKLS